VASLTISAREKDATVYGQLSVIANSVPTILFADISNKTEL